jgi:hypothetical protein
MHLAENVREEKDSFEGHKGRKEDKDGQGKRQVGNLKKELFEMKSNGVIY